MAENGFSKSRIIHQCEPFPNRFINENVSQHVALAKVYNKTLTHFQKVKTLDQPEIIFELYALSFYRSQNVYWIASLSPNGGQLAHALELEVGLREEGDAEGEVVHPELTVELTLLTEVDQQRLGHLLKNVSR